MNRVRNAWDTQQEASELAQRVQDADQIYRYFVKRDSMNAEVHFDRDRDYWTDRPNVRLSPITLAAERLFEWIFKEAFGDDKAEYPLYVQQQIKKKNREDRVLRTSNSKEYLEHIAAKVDADAEDAKNAQVVSYVNIRSSTD